VKTFRPQPSKTAFLPSNCGTWVKAEAIKDGSGSYDLACIFALRDDEPNCRKWLETGQEAGTLPTRGHAMKDEDLKNMREKDWFGEIGWK